MTDKYVLNEIVAFDENREHETKSVQNAQNPVKAIVDKYVEEYINAFLNTNGGTIYFGIDDGGHVLGVQLDRNQRDNLRTQIDQIVQRFDPSLEPDMYQVHFVPVENGKSDSNLWVIEIRVSRGTEPLYLTGSQKAYLRRDGGNFQMGFDLIQRRMRVGYSAPQPALHQLPVDLRDFTGRAEYVDLLESESAHLGVAVIVGMGGVGKSSLANHVAHRIQSRFPDAQVYLDLRGSTTSPLSTRDAIESILRAFDPTQVLPRDPAELIAYYRSVLYGKRVLILLDDANTVDQVQPLIVGEGNCAVIITSRHSIVLPGVQLIRLDVLTLEESRNLLTSICPRLARTSAEQRTSTVDVIAELCGCLPLALRLVGSTLQERIDLAVDDYIVRLRDTRSRLELIDASLSLSFEVLDSEVQRVWCKLSVFPGTFDRAATAAIWQVDMDRAQSVLSSLTALSLIEWDAIATRYHLHDLARVFADAQLAFTDRAETQRHFAQHYEDVLDNANAMYSKGDSSRQQGLSQFDQEWLNICFGQAWAAECSKQGDESIMKLCVAYAISGSTLLRFRRGYLAQTKWCEIGLDCARQLGDRSSENVLLAGLANAYFSLGELNRALDYHGAALSVAHDIEDRDSEREALCGLGVAYLNLGSSELGFEKLVQAQKIAVAQSDRRSEATILWKLGLAYVHRGDIDRGTICYGEALQITKEVSDHHLEGHLLESLGAANAARGKTRSATKLFRQAIEAFEASDRRPCEGTALRSIANFYERTGKLQESKKYYEQAVSIFNERGDWYDGQFALADLGRIYVSLHQYELASNTFQQALDLARLIGDRYSEGFMLYVLGDFYKSRNLAQQALDNFEQAFEIVRALGTSHSAAHVLAGLGAGYLSLASPQKAIECYEFAVAYLHESNARRCELQAVWGLGNAFRKAGNRAKAIESAQIGFRYQAELMYGMQPTTAREIASTLPDWFTLAMLRLNGPGRRWNLRLRLPRKIRQKEANFLAKLIRLIEG